MKKVKCLTWVLIVLIAGMWTSVFAADENHLEAEEHLHDAHFDIKLYDKLSKKNIGRILSGNIDVDLMVSDMEELLEQGIKGAEAHMEDSHTPAVEAKMMKSLIENHEKMITMTLDDLETQWHEGAALKSQGIDISKMDPLGEAMRHLELIVYPAEAIICLKQYKNTKDEDLLEIMEESLVEARDHLKHLEG
jgi:hypothetical protein